MNSGIECPSGAAPTDYPFDQPAPLATMFVVGPPRSGTTLLAFLLSQRMAALTLSEPFLVFNVAPAWLVKRYFRRVRKAGNLQWQEPPCLCGGQTKLLDYMTRLAHRNRFSSLIIKETFRCGGAWDNVDFLNEIAYQFPVAAITRHPFDVAASSLRAFRWCRGPVGRLLRLFAADMPIFADDHELIEYVAQNWLRFAIWADSTAKCRIRYEDLVAEPVTRINDLCSQREFGLQEQGKDNLPLRRTFAGIGDPTVFRHPRPVHLGSINRARELCPAFRRRLIQICGPAMAELGYAIDGNAIPQTN